MIIHQAEVEGKSYTGRLTTYTSMYQKHAISKHMRFINSIAVHDMHTEHINANINI